AAASPTTCARGSSSSSRAAPRPPGLRAADSAWRSRSRTPRPTAATSSSTAATAPARGSSSSYRSGSFEPVPTELEGVDRSVPTDARAKPARPDGRRRRVGASSARRRDVAVARVDEAVEPVAGESGRGEAERVRAVRLLRELLERSVDPDRVLGVVLDGSADCEDPDQREHHATGQVSGDPRTGAPLPRGRAHASRLPAVLELERDAAIGVPESRADDNRARDPHEPGPGGPRQQLRRRVARLRGPRLAPPAP